MQNLKVNGLSKAAKVSTQARDPWTVQVEKTRKNNLKVTLDRSLRVFSGVFYRYVIIKIVGYLCH